jgi:hypothetical protein
MEPDAVKDDEASTSVGSHCQPCSPSNGSSQHVCPMMIELFKNHAVCKSCRPRKLKKKKPCRWLRDNLKMQRSCCPFCANYRISAAL